MLMTATSHLCETKGVGGSHTSSPSLVQRRRLSRMNDHSCYSPCSLLTSSTCWSCVSLQQHKAPRDHPTQIANFRLPSTERRQVQCKAIKAFSSRRCVGFIAPSASHKRSWYQSATCARTDAHNNTHSNSCLYLKWR